jgi:hypothetical protein
MREKGLEKTRPQPLAPSPKEILGGYAEGVTPVPIPNTEVKPLRADGTARAAVWESRSPPGLLQEEPATNYGCGLFALVHHK